MGAIFLVLTFCLVEAAYGGPTMPVSYDTIIVGLGASGCTAASRLAQAGKRVLAVEAQDRIGGRVNTVPFGDGVVELGAEWIHGQHPSRVYDLAIKNNVSVLPQDLAFQVYRSDGSSSGHEIVNELMNFALEVVDDPPEKPEPLGQYITKRVMEYIKEKYPQLANDKDYIEELLHFMDLIIDNYESSDNWNEVSTHTQYEELEGHQHMSWHKHGYKTLFEILLNTYNKGPGYQNLEIKLNTEVTQISWPQDPNEKVVVTCKDGATYTAENVIVTVSLGVLKERHSSLFSPQLPDNKVSVIDNLSMGLLGKVVLSFSQVWWTECKGVTFFWRKQDKIGIDDWTTNIVGASCPKGSDNTFTVWTAGEVGRLVETLPEDVVRRKVIEILRRFMGANITIPEPTAMLRSNWYSNPFTRGSYTFDNLSAPQNPNARVDLSQPLLDAAGKPRVLFAGEATNPTHFSTVHGATDTGYREAMRLLHTASKI